MATEDLKKIFDESIGGTKAYFISKVQQKYPRLDKKDIETWFKSQEVVQINTTVKGVNLKITAKSRTFQIDIMFCRIGQSLKPFLLLVDIMSRKAFCYSIPGEKNMSKIITAYNKFLQEVDYVKGVEGDGEFDNTAFKKLNEEKGIQVYTSVAKDNHFTSQKIFFLKVCGELMQGRKRANYAGKWSRHDAKRSDTTGQCLYDV